MMSVESGMLRGIADLNFAKRGGRDSVRKER
jgi:hypothetical protein